MELFLGIDTSCYTTSLALIDGEGNLFSQARKLLRVPEGGRGLAQNEAVFQHVANIPVLLNSLIKSHGTLQITAVAASTRPRPVEGSYMPVFKVGESFGRSIAALYGLPFIETTHQEGHVAAGIWSAQGPREEEFLAVHVSGGTTELLKIKKGALDTGHFFEIKLMGGSKDLHAGQFVDRIGVQLGLPFPAGPHLEKLAADSLGEYSIPSSVKGYDLSFSGPEAAALRMINGQIQPSEIARAVEKCIVNSLEKIIRKAVTEKQLKSVLVVGGVAANSFIRERLANKLMSTHIKLFFAEPALSSDNAVGAAVIGMNKYTGQ